MSAPQLILLPHEDEHAAHAALQHHRVAAHVAARPLQPVTDWGRDVMQAVTKDEGFTLHDAIGDGPRTGYMVSVDKGTEKVIPLRDLRPEDIADYRDLHQQELADPSSFLGAWVWKGKVYLDVSKHFDDLAQAMEAARQHDQIGVYDIAKGETILTADYFDKKVAYFTLETSDLDVTNRLRTMAGLKPLVHDTRNAIARQALRLVAAEGEFTADSSPRYVNGKYIHRGHVTRGGRLHAGCSHSHATPDLAKRCAQAALPALQRGDTPRGWVME